MSASVNEWLAAFLNARPRGLERPDGRPLYAYRMQSYEFEDLAKTLRICLKSFYGTVNWLKNTERLFVLYAAEWSRRKYSGGPWRWEDMTASIGWPSLSIKDRQTLTKSGMAYWKRKLNQLDSGATSYLMSVATEGGFPVKLVERSETHLSRYLKAILDDYAMYSGAGLAAEKIAESHSLRLPSAFRRSAVYKLAADTVEAVYALSEGLEDKASPFETLEREQPGWQTNLPLSFEEDNVRVLVDGLLKKAQEKRQIKFNKLKISRRFSCNSENCWQHFAKVELTSEIPLRLISEELGVAEGSLPRRLELAFFAEGRLTKVASLSRESESYFVYPYSPEKLLLNIAAESQINCVIMEYGGERMGDLSIAGADGLDEELPVSCYMDNDQLVCLGQGGIRSRLEHLYVLLPADCMIMEGENYERLNYRNLGFQEGGRWFKLNGGIQVDLNDSFSCWLRANEQSDFISDCVLKGRRQYLYESRNNPVFCGEPSIYRTLNGVYKQVPENSIFWSYIGGRGEWNSLASNRPVGDVRLRVVDNDDCIFSGRCSVLPVGFQVHIKPSEDPLNGQLLIEGHGGAKVAAASIDGLSIAARDDNDVLVLDCRASQPFAGKLAISLIWDGGSRSKLLLPFPGQGAHFIDIQGDQIAQRVISVNQLMSISAVAVSYVQHVKFELHGLLRANDISNSISRSSLNFSRSIHAVSKGYYELPLVELHTAMRDLFSYSADLDATVLLEIVSNGSSLARVEVVQFDSQLLYVPETGRVIHRCNDNKPLDKPLEIQLISMVGGEVPVIDNEYLDSDDGYAWQLSDIDAQTTPCLAVGSSGMQRNVRPCVIYSKETLDEPEAVLTDDSAPKLEIIFVKSSKSDRSQSLQSYIKYLLANPGSDGWGDLVAAVRRFSGAHPDSIDLYEEIIGSPEVSAGLLIRMTPNDLNTLVEWQGYLPFRWWQLPETFLTKALIDYIQYIEQNQKNYKDLLIDSAVNQVNKLGELVTGFEFIADVALSKVFSASYKSKFPSLLQLNSKVLYELVNDKFKQDLYAQLGDEKWPNGLSREDWEKFFENRLPWLDDNRMGYRRPLLDAIVAQSYSVINGRYLTNEQRAFVSAMRATCPVLFDRLFLMMSICFYKASKEE